MSNFNNTKMKKIYIITLTVFLNCVLFSCTPENLSDEINTTQLCCGQDGDIDPPPPPPQPTEEED